MSEIVKITLENVFKTYNQRDYILKDINLALKSGNIYGIKGDNGSGKSTLLKIISGLLRVDKGKISYEIDNKIISKEDFINYYSYVAPYSNLYNEFNLEELFSFVNDLNGGKSNKTIFNELLTDFNLLDKAKTPIKEFSSGMIQRTKLILALSSSKPILMLDEPSTNLDVKGIEVMKRCIDKFHSQSSMIIIASNEEDEINLCNSIINLS